VEKLTWKIRVAVLWIGLAVSTSAHSLLKMMEPGVVKDLLDNGTLPGGEKPTPGSLIMLGTLFWLVPLLLAFLTLVLTDSVNRWVSGVVGLALGLMWGSELFAGEEFGGAALVSVAAAVVGLLIVWHAWKWPKQADGVA
jgi:hypothetical protein